LAVLYSTRPVKKPFGEMSLGRVTNMTLFSHFKVILLQVSLKWRHFVDVLAGLLFAIYAK